MKVVIKISPLCNLCGICEEHCPVGVFKVGGGALQVRQELCIYCKGCETLCPAKAIELVALTEDLEVSKVSTLR